MLSQRTWYLAYGTERGTGLGVSPGIKAPLSPRTCHSLNTCSSNTALPTELELPIMTWN